MKFKSKTTLISGMLLSTLFLSACTPSINPDAKLLSVSGEDVVSLGYANFVAKYGQCEYDMSFGSYFGDEMWTQEMTSSGTTFETQVKDDMLEGLKKSYVQVAHASDYKIALTKEENKAIEKAADTFMEANSKEAIEALGATKEYVVRYLEEATIARRVKEAVEKEAKVNVTKEESEQRTISYVLFSTEPTTDEEGNSVELTDEEKAAKKEAAMMVAEAPDFEKAIEESGETLQTHSFTIADDPAQDTIVSEEVINEAAKLQEGECSGVIESEGMGYFVIRLDALLDEEATADKVKELEAEKRSAHYDEQIEKWVEETSWTVDEKEWKKVVFNQLFERTVSDSTSEDE